MVIKVVIEDADVSSAEGEDGGLCLMTGVTRKPAGC